MNYRAAWHVTSPMEGEAEGVVESHDFALAIVHAAVEAANDATGMRLAAPTKVEIELTFGDY